MSYESSSHPSQPRPPISSEQRAPLITRRNYFLERTRGMLSDWYTQADLWRQSTTVRNIADLLGKEGVEAGFPCMPQAIVDSMIGESPYNTIFRMTVENLARGISRGLRNSELRTRMQEILHTRSGNENINRSAEAMTIDYILGNITEDRFHFLSSHPTDPGRVAAVVADTGYAVNAGLQFLYLLNGNQIVTASMTPESIITSLIPSVTTDDELAADLQDIQTWRERHEFTPVRREEIYTVFTTFFNTIHARFSHLRKHPSAERMDDELRRIIIHKETGYFVEPDQASEEWRVFAFKYSDMRNGENTRIGDIILLLRRAIIDGFEIRDRDDRDSQDQRVFASDALTLSDNQIAGLMPGRDVAVPDLSLVREILINIVTIDADFHTATGRPNREQFKIAAKRVALQLGFNTRQEMIDYIRIATSGTSGRTVLNAILDGRLELYPSEMLFDEEALNLPGERD